MTTGKLTLRHPETPAEVDDFLRLARAAFEPDDSPVDAGGLRDEIVGAPGFEPSQLRCAFQDDRMVGACVVQERTLRLGPSRLRTGCVGLVGTHPEHRRQGVASAVLADALAYSRARRQALLLLDGMSGFYARFGYVDVFDPTVHAIERHDVLHLPASPCRVRAIALDDAPALLALYERHYGRRSGSFDRDLEWQTHVVRRALSEREPVLALGTDGSVRGYLLWNWDSPASAGEVAADDWPSALALLQYQAQLLAEREDSAPELLWPLPSDSPTFYALSDHLRVQSVTRRDPDSDWQARVSCLPELTRSLVPLWRSRLARSARPWSGVLGITFEGEDSAQLALEIGQDVVLVPERVPAATVRVALSSTVFTRLLFGQRPVSWAAEQPGQAIPHEARAALEVLLPREPVWIPGSDSF